MPIAFEARRGRIMEGRGLIPRLSACLPVFDQPELGRNDSARKSSAAYEEEASCSSSSIGQNSSDSGGGGQSFSGSDGEDSGEVQSSYKGPLDRMDALEDSLPIRRGISKFYNGKSQSFTSIPVDSADTSAKYLAKPGNAYNRKRRNAQSTNNYLERNHGSLQRRTGSISKKPTNSIRNKFAAAAAAMDGSESSKSDEHEPGLPPLPPQRKSSMNLSPENLSSSLLSFSARSISLVDLQSASSGMLFCPTDKQMKFF